MLTVARIYLYKSANVKVVDSHEGVEVGPRDTCASYLSQLLLIRDDQVADAFESFFHDARTSKISMKTSSMASSVKAGSENLFEGSD